MSRIIALTTCKTKGAKKQGITRETKNGRGGKRKVLWSGETRVCKRVLITLTTCVETCMELPLPGNTNTSGCRGGGGEQ